MGWSGMVTPNTAQSGVLSERETRSMQRVHPGRSPFRRTRKGFREEEF